MSLDLAAGGYVVSSARCPGCGNADVFPAIRDNLGGTASFVMICAFCGAKLPFPI